jgi:hypothetical protein
MLGLSVLLAALTLTRTVAGLVVVSVTFGLLTVALQTGIGALSQIAVDNALMGRFVGLMAVVPGIVSVVAMTFAGTAGAAFGVRAVFLAGGAVLAVTTASAWRGLRRPSGAADEPSRTGAGRDIVPRRSDSGRDA